eukprot:TRINITY_DN975_c0_g1_i1.p1 TRINITY_DN975_c0_g1~~TRINITY_DN975_c0_g1_i1.p1  ORF type:complete len:629 (+),score=181.30 TRINITY_DN975_c0_g1_i1:61-1947(+)
MSNRRKKNQKRIREAEENQVKHSDIEVVSDNESAPKVPMLSKKQRNRLKKQLLSGEISQEEYDDALGIQHTAVVEEAPSVKNSGLSGQVALASEDSNAKDIHITNISINYGTRVLFTEAELHINHGRRYGLIGPNGHGKSTLLRHIADRHLIIPKHISILYVEQEVEGNEVSALDFVVNSDTERLELLTREAELEKQSQESADAYEIIEELEEVRFRLREIKAYSAEKRAISILQGLGFTEKMRTKPTIEFSGGWRMRISLARALYLTPDLLLLDEPTNHLDLDACIWLEEYLKQWPTTLLVVSHDREFLNWVVTDVIYLTNKKLDYYKGDYDAFNTLKVQRRKTLEKKAKLQQKEIKRLRSKQDPKSKQELEKILANEIVVNKDYRVRFTFFDPPHIDPPILEVRDLAFAYNPSDPDDVFLFDGVELNVDIGARIGIVGPNGVGKSTLMNLMLGELQPTEGEIILNRKLTIAKFAQHFVDILPDKISPLAYISSLFPEVQPQMIRNRLGMYGLPGEMHDESLTLLSGGQKSRTILTMLSFKQPHFYFLDEPTNHLDIESVDALIDALNEYTGGLVIISHDQRLISRCCNELWVCRGDALVEIYDGTFDDYRDEIISQIEWPSEDDDY